MPKDPLLLHMRRYDQHKYAPDVGGIKKVRVQKIGFEPDDTEPIFGQNIREAIEVFRYVCKHIRKGILKHVGKKAV
jgi:hypothetical protein